MKRHNCSYVMDNFVKTQKNVSPEGTFFGISIDFVEFYHI